MEAFGRTFRKTDRTNRGSTRTLANARIGVREKLVGLLRSFNRVNFTYGSSSMSSDNNRLYEKSSSNNNRRVLPPLCRRRLSWLLAPSRERGRFLLLAIPVFGNDHVRRIVDLLLWHQCVALSPPNHSLPRPRSLVLPIWKQPNPSSPSLSLPLDLQYSSSNNRWGALGLIRGCR